MKQYKFLSALFAAMLILAACATPTTESPKPTVPIPTLFPTPSLLEVKFDNGVSASVREDAQMALAIGNNYFLKIGGDKSFKITIYAYDDIENLIQAHYEYLRLNQVRLSGDETGPNGYIRAYWIPSGCRAQSIGNVAFFKVSACVTPDKIRTYKILAHEYFHTQQANLVGAASVVASYSVPPDQMKITGPTWLKEGSAEYLAFRAIDVAGMYSFTNERSKRIDKSKSLSTPLSIMETQANHLKYDTSEYSLGFLATELLVKNKGDSSLLEFYRLIGAGVLWQQAFISAFGKSSAEFYKEFEQQRVLGFK